MTNRLRKPPNLLKASRISRCSHIVGTLSREILDNPSEHAFLLESEYTLCQRFSVSRVTVRLALSDLERRGLIYRRHGIGTFAYGRLAQPRRHIGVLIKMPTTEENRHLAEFLRGVQTFARQLRSAVILINQSPQEWSSELSGVLSGVIVTVEQVTAQDLDSLNLRKLPYFLLGETDLPGARLFHNSDSVIQSPAHDYFDAGYIAAETLSRVAMTGEPLRSVAISFPCATLQPRLA